MTADARLIRRSVELKRALSEFARGPRFRRALGQVIKERFGDAVAIDPADTANATDHFLLQHRLRDGRTVVAHFVESHPELAEEERAMLLAWQDVVEGIFEVRGREGEALIAFNIIDELTYRIRSNVGPGVFDQMPRGSFLVTRLVPLGDEWLMSGVGGVLPAAERSSAHDLARRMALAHPGLVLRNPEKLERAWEMQREDRRQFISFFGSDEVVLPGREVAGRMRAFRHFQVYEVRDAEGRSMADRAKEAYGYVPAEPELELPEDLQRAQTVGLIHDEQEGLHYLAEFGTVAETFANPSLAADRPHREAVLGYLREPSIPPLAFRRLAQRDPERASQLFRRLLNRPSFSWERDGEALLRQHKASYFQRSPRPGITPISMGLAGGPPPASNSPPRPRRGQPG